MLSAAILKEENKEVKVKEIFMVPECTMLNVQNFHSTHTLLRSAFLVIKASVILPASSNPYTCVLAIPARCNPRF